MINLFLYNKIKQLTKFNGTHNPGCEFNQRVESKNFIFFIFLIHHLV